MKKTLVVLAITASVIGCGKSDPDIGKGPSTIAPMGESSNPQPAVEPAQAPTADALPKENIKHGDTTITPSGLKYIDTKIGKGDQPKQGQQVTVNYTGRLTDGKIFDSNIDPSSTHKKPFTTVIGVGKVIKGWDEGIVSMKVGGKRRLIVPGDLGYGMNGTPDGKIPPNATLIFDVELLKVQ